ncbi:tyrosine-type recombinase/integrase [Ramlibacter rhizophilus]|uniref:Site-specific integrase n=1 Tax=Ramlibacter rhizophilus TaxID=1781167 RepID=A0A4Z0BHD3_9BURK|nr:site-specific integrase [Ramlibacter rhizophilus]TFY98712.1 site-specific integrase [Ramlibacter rhizophilus]
MRNFTAKRIDLASAVRSVADQPAADLTLSELARAYAVATLDASGERIRKWLEAFGSEPAWAVSSERLEVAAQAMLEHGYAPASVNRDLSTLGSCYRWAVKQRLAPRAFKSPTVGVRRFDEGIRRVHVEREQLRALRSRALAFKDRRFGVFVALLIDTGARKGEILERRWTDVNLDKREILAPMTKNGTPRVLFFSEETAALITRVYPEAQRRPERLLFEGRVPGQPISYRRIWNQVAAEVGLADFHIHDVRHAAAASLLRAGVTLAVAAQVLGYDPAVLSRRYGHLETEALRRAQESAWR